METSNAQNKQLTADGVFSWDELSQNVKKAFFPWALILTVVCISCVGMLLANPIVAMYGPWVVYGTTGGGIIIIGWFLFLAFFQGIGPLHNAAYRQKCITAWQTYATKVSRNMMDIPSRKNVVVAAGQECLFEDMLNADAAFLRKYEKSDHEQQLEVFMFAMEHAGPTMLGRMVAVLRGYAYWEKRFTSLSILT